MSNLVALQTQIAQLQAQTQNYNPLAAIVPTGSDMVLKIESMVEAAIAKQMKGLEKFLETKLSSAAPPPEAEKKALTVLEAIGLGLSPEEQTWLSKPEVLKAVPDFLASKEGMEFTKMFVSEFRSSYGD